MSNKYWMDIYCDHEYKGKKHKPGVFRIFPILTNGCVTLLIDDPKGKDIVTNKKSEKQ